MQRLAETCDPVRDQKDFVEALRAVDNLTAENTIWEVLLPKVKDNLQMMLGNEAFEELILGQPALALRIFGFIAASEGVKESG